MKVVKFGATSGFTHGMIDGIGGAYEVDYSAFGDHKRWIDGVRVVVDPDFPESENQLRRRFRSCVGEPGQREGSCPSFRREDGLGPTAEYALVQPLLRVLGMLDVAYQ